MATDFWNRFGETLQTSPRLSLAAFLGHPPSIIEAKKEGIHFPKTTDFQVDPAYDPNFHRLDLEEELLQTNFFVRCISAWGEEALLRTVNACSLLQCAHETSADPEFRALSTRAAFALQSVLDDPSEEHRSHAATVLQACSAAYQKFEDSPDDPEAHNTWYQLGAPWLALETFFATGGVRKGETEPAPANSTWIARETVWPTRTSRAAANWTSHQLVRNTVRSALISWAVRPA